MPIIPPGSQFSPSEGRQIILNPDEKDFVESALPLGSQIRSAAYFDNYDLPCPIRVQAVTPAGNMVEVVLRKARTGDVETEARIISAVARYGLPVPVVLAGPETVSGGAKVTVLSLLPGINLQQLSMRGGESVVAAKRLLIEAIGKLSALTPQLQKDPVGLLLPSIPVNEMLARVFAADDPWLNDPKVAHAAERLANLIPAITLPLVFSNGDYQPGNFLTDGTAITGFVDFEAAGFFDPLIGIAKFPVYDLHPLNRAAFVSDFLSATGYDRDYYALRVSLRALIALQKEVPPLNRSKEQEKYRVRLFNLLEESD